MRKFIVAALTAASLLASPVAHSAVPAYTPLQTEHSDMWVDYSRPGVGFSFTVREETDDVFVVVYSYDAAGAPTFFAAQGRITREATELPVYQVTQGSFDLGSAVPATLVRTGTLTIYPQSCESIHVDIETDAEGEAIFLLERVFPVEGESTCMENACPYVDFGPTQELCD